MKKATNIISLIIWLALAAAEVFLSMNILQLDMLPAKYLYIFFAVLVLVALLMGMMMYRRVKEGQKKTKGLVTQIIGWILSLLIILGCVSAAQAVQRVNDVIDSVTEQPSVSAVVDIYVMAEDPAQTLEDARDYTFAITEFYDWENTQRAIAAIETELGVTLKTVKYPHVFAMIDALYSGEANALFLNSAYVDILDELEGYSDFASLTRILHEHAIYETQQPQETTTPETTAPEASAPATEPSAQDTDPEQVAPFVIYLSGSDTRSKVLKVSRSDVNILAVVNPQTRQILLVNTPRDYFVENPALGGARDKLTHCGIYGVDCSIEALENLYGTDITYYAQINFTGFETLIDAIGGITVYSNVAFTTTHGGYRIHEGFNDLNGHQALCFARERYNLAGGDRDRGKNQMKIISAVVDKLSASTLLSNYGSIMESMEDMFITNMPQDEMTKLVKSQLGDMGAWRIISTAANGTGGSDITASMPGMKVYVMYPNQDTVNHAASLIDRVLSGDIITEAELK